MLGTQDMTNGGLNPDRPLSVLGRMLLVWRFEEKGLDLWAGGAFTGHFHVAIRHEATAVGAMCALSASDLIFSNHRNHGHVIGRGAAPAGALAEILGRAAGLLGGRGGTFHLADPALGMPHTSALVGASAALAAGAAYGARLTRRGGVSVGFIGDAALGEGIVLEAMTLARQWSLPVIFICEDNRRQTVSAAGADDTDAPGDGPPDLVALPRALGILGMTVDGGDVSAVRDIVGAAHRHCMEGSGPVFVEAKVPLWPGNEDQWPEPVTGSTDLSDAFAAPPTRRDHADWYASRDPVLRYCRHLLRTGDVTESDIIDLDQEVQTTIGAAAAEALASDFPPPQSALDEIFA